MRHLVVTVLVAVLYAPPALAQEPKKAQTEQEKRTAACNKQATAKGMKGRELNQFMSTCLRDSQPKAKK